MAIRLQQQGLRTHPVIEDGLPVEVGGVQLCTVTPDSRTKYDPAVMSEAERELVVHKVASTVQTVKEYMSMMEAAPKLKACGLEGDYRALAEINGVVLAGHPTKYGVEFVTWEWVQDHTALWQGHYTGDYTAAKEDFAVRSGMLPKDRVFTDRQLTEMYRCVHETLESGYPLTREREKILSGITAQIEQAVPDLNKLVYKSNEEEMPTLIL